MTEDHIDESDSDQRESDPCERYNTLMEIREGSFQGKLIKIEDTSVKNTGTDERLSITEVHTKRTYPCDVSGTYFQGTQKKVYTNINIKEEDRSVDDDYGGEASFIRECSEESDSDLQNDGEHCSEELMPRLTSDNVVKVWIFYLQSLALISFSRNGECSIKSRSLFAFVFLER